MDNKRLRPKASQCPDPQEKQVFGDGITPSQEQYAFPARPPKSLVDWLVQVHSRLLAMDQGRNDDTS